VDVTVPSLFLSLSLSPLSLSYLSPFLPGLQASRVIRLTFHNHGSFNTWCVSGNDSCISACPASCFKTLITTRNHHYHDQPARSSFTPTT